MYNNHNPMINKQGGEDMTKYITEYPMTPKCAFPDKDSKIKEETILESHLNWFVNINERINRVTNQLNELGYKLDSGQVEYTIFDPKEPSKDFTGLFYTELLRLANYIDFLENIKNKFNKVI